jgi:hypothetical protein
MSGLGETVVPSGTPNEVAGGGIPAQEPATIPSNSASIAQGTSTDTTEKLLHSKFIWKATYTWSTAMPAGTIIAIQPNHPSACNFITDTISSIHNMWVGGMICRTRALATAWYGGSLRMARIPPNVTQAQIRNMSLQNLTAFPNLDMDPKNTTFAEFVLEDQREIAYHYMKAFDDSDPHNFGGYLVLFVAGRLVTQSDSFTTVQILWENSGNFTFVQPTPSLSITDTFTGPLSVSLQIPVAKQPLCDVMHSGDSMVVNIHPSTITSMDAGFFKAAPLGKSKYDATVPGVAVSDPAMLNTLQLLPPESTPNLTLDSPEYIASSQPLFTAVGASGNITALGWTTIAGASSISTQQVGYGSSNVRIHATTGTRTGPDSYPDPATEGYGFIYNYTYPTYVNPAASFVGTPPMTLSPMASGESIVTFAYPPTRNFAIQTSLMAADCASFKGSESTTSYLYSIRSPTGTPLLVVRLNPNGIFSTNAVTTSVTIPLTAGIGQYLTMQYEGTLDIAQPLPPLTYQTRKFLNELRLAPKRAIKQKVNERELLLEELSLY